MSDRNLSASKTFPFILWGLIQGATKVASTQLGTAQGGCSGTVGLVLPHRSSAGPSMLSRVPCGCPAFPSLVTTPARCLNGDTAALLKIHTHIHMHPYVKKEEFVTRWRAALLFLSIMCPCGFARAASETWWDQWVPSQDLPNAHY